MKNFIFRKPLVLALIMSLLPVPALQAARRLLALSKVDHTLVIIDPVSLTIEKRIPVGADPHEVLASPDGKRAYVSNTGYGAGHELDILDLQTGKPVMAFNTSPAFGPHGLAFVNGHLWFTAQGSKAIARFNPDSAGLDLVLGTGQNTTHLLWVAPDEKTICATNVESGTVSIFETLLLQPAMPPTGVMPAAAKPRMDWIQTLIPVGQGAEGFDVLPDGSELWTARPDGKLAMVDVRGKRLIDTMDIRLPGAHRMKFTPDGRQMFIVSVRTGELVVMDVAGRREISRIQTGHGAGMLMDPVGSRVLISCTPDHYIAVIDLKTLKETARLEIGDRPDGMAWVDIP